MTVASEHIERTRAALARTIPHEYDLAAWPEDVRDTVEEVCRLWNLRPPNTKKGKAFWIQQARELMDACAEWGLDALREYRGEFKAQMQHNMDRGLGGVAPHTVSGPQSLVNPVRAQAGKMRENGYVSTGTGYDESDPGRRYITGKYAEFIVHS